MKSLCPVVIATLVALLLSACSTISREDCKKNMKEMGLIHGRKGLNNFTDEIRKVCMRDNSDIDLEGYAKNFDIGWSEYCTPLHGFENGQKGFPYKNYCPSDKEILYREKFYIGKKINEKNDQVIEIEDKVKELTQSSEQDLTSKDHLQKLNDYLQTIKREIQMLELAGKSPIHKDI